MAVEISADQNENFMRWIEGEALGCRVLTGSMHVRSFDWVEHSSNNHETSGRAKLFTDRTVHVRTLLSHKIPAAVHGQCFIAGSFSSTACSKAAAMRDDSMTPYRGAAT